MQHNRVVDSSHQNETSHETNGISVFRPCFCKENKYSISVRKPKNRNITILVFLFYYYNNNIIFIIIII